MMIRNSIAIQDSASMGDPLKFQYGGSKSNPKDFFQHPAENWFWTGHGVFANEKLIVFLIEEHSIESDPGFEACGWYIAIIDNSGEIPDKWNIDYIKGPDTDGIIIGSSAVLKDERFIYAFGVREPATHESYLVRFPIDKLTEGSFADMQWMENNQWKNQLPANRTAASLFIGQTEFSVHYDPKLQKFIQIQTLGYGRASIAYRLADQLHGPWSGPEIIYTPALEDGSEYIYTANAHPEFGTDEIIVTYNVNSSAFETLKMNEEIYFPRILRLEFRK